MKTRSDFVTNSSSSSFICEVCGSEASGWDMCASEAGMCECENGHTFCTDHKLDLNQGELIDYCLKKIDAHKGSSYCKDEVVELTNLLEKFKQQDCEDEDVEREIMEVLENKWDIEYSIPEQICPICSLEFIPTGTILAYILKRDGIESNTIESEIRKLFKTDGEIWEHIRK